MSQPAYDPMPLPTYVYIPPADGRCRASSPYRVGGEQDGDQGEHDRQRRDAEGETRREANREDDGDRRRHEGDALEQHLGQTDRVPFEALRDCEAIESSLRPALMG